MNRVTRGVERARGISARVRVDARIGAVRRSVLR